MGMLFQSGALFAEFSVFENVAFPSPVHTDLDEDLIRLVVLMKLEAVGLRGACGFDAVGAIRWDATSGCTCACDCTRS